MADSIRLTRQELYDRVWSTPLSKLGPELGLSGRGLAKRCAGEGIPVPTRGYWAKKEFGWSPSQVTLPTRTSDQSEVIEFHLDPMGPASGSAGTAQDLEPVPVPESLEKPHPLVRATLKASRGTKQREDRLVVLDGPGGLTVRASRPSLDRALRILEAVVRTTEAKGCTVRPAGGADKSSAIIKGEDSVGFWIEESVTRTEKPLTARQLKEKERNRWLHSGPRIVYKPTGTLTLRLVFGDSGRRGAWSDGARQRLEGLLPRAVASVSDAFDAAAARRAELARQLEERERQRQEERRAVLEQFQNDRRVAVVRRRIALWRDVRRVKEWRQEVRLRGDSAPHPATDDQWARWIEQYLQDLEAEALRLPAFEAEPTNEERSKYGLWGH